MQQGEQYSNRLCVCVCYTYVNLHKPLAYIWADVHVQCVKWAGRVKHLNRRGRSRDKAYNTRSAYSVLSHDKNMPSSSRETTQKLFARVKFAMCIKPCIQNNGPWRNWPVVGYWIIEAREYDKSNTGALYKFQYNGINVYIKHRRSMQLSELFANYKKLLFNFFLFIKIHI